MIYDINKRESEIAMYSIGMDIQDIEAFRRRPYGENQRFYRRLFTDSEIEYCLARKNPSAHFAARFAAKEAAMKALDPFRVFPRDIEIRLLPSGKPEIFIHRPGALPDGHRIEISISHSDAQAAAAALVHPE